MNNLVLAALCLGASSVLFLAERAVHHRISAENRRPASLVSQAEQQQSRTAEQLGADRAELEQRRATAKEQRAAFAAEPQTFAAPPLDPQHEGVWPAGKPYFYLPKDFLPSLAFGHFQFSNGSFQLHPNTVALLGLTDAEAANISDSFGNLVAQFKELESQRIAPSPRHASEKFSSGKKTSYRLPPLREEMEPFVEEFLASTRALLGKSRTDIFESWAKDCIAESLGDFAPKARILTLTQEPKWSTKQLTRLEVVEEGGGHLYYGELWDPADKNEGIAHPHRYQHLFGDNGKLRPGEQAAR
jgi:hypothetical protein